MVGASVKLHVKTLSGYDTLNDPVYADTSVTVDNVLIGQPSTEDITDSIQLYGKKIEYMLGIPKGDTHIWTDTEVEFFGKKFRTFGETIEGIEANIPTPWHKKVRVERCV
jgi:hypothetical protein